MSWKTRYGFVAVSALDGLIMEGMNEKGLSSGVLYFEDIKYPAIKPGDEVVKVEDAIAWILGNFQTVEEVEKALARIKLWSDENNFFHRPMPLHTYVTDASGGSIVIECIDGKVKIWDNRTNGVMTNEPNLGWHLTNLRFYSNANPLTPSLPELGGEDWALGSGMMSLPGDYSCAGRFVRTSLLKRYSKQPEKAEGGVNLALHLINAVDIPYGPQVWIQGQTKNIQWTIWSVIYDHTNKHFYYRTYENPTLRRFDFANLDFQEGLRGGESKYSGGSATPTTPIGCAGEPGFHRLDNTTFSFSACRVTLDLLGISSRSAKSLPERRMGMNTFLLTKFPEMIGSVIERLFQ